MIGLNSDRDQVGLLKFETVKLEKKRRGMLTPRTLLNTVQTETSLAT